MPTTFKQLPLHALFEMRGASFDLGRTYTKRSARTYAQVDATGGAMAPVYRVGTIKVEVHPVQKEFHRV